jgi:hypothetical protein
VNVVACLIASFISLCHCSLESKRDTIRRANEVLGNHRRESKQSRLELGLRRRD